MGIFLVQSVTGVEPALPGFGRNFNTADRPPNRLSYAPTGYGIQYGQKIHSAVIIREIWLRGFLGTHCFDTFFTGSNCALGQTLSPA